MTMATEQATHEVKSGGPCYRPNVDILETPSELVIRADMPGVGRENIDIAFEAGSLTIHGRVSPRHPRGTGHVLQEYGVGDYQRVFSVGRELDPSRFSAAYADGVLTITIPRPERVAPKRIAVEVR